MQIRDNLDVAQLVGGLDVGALDVSSSANISNFLISVDQTSIPQTLTITSVASGGDNGGRAITGVAHVQVDNLAQSVTVLSWRVD